MGRVCADWRLHTVAKAPKMFSLIFDECLEPWQNTIFFWFRKDSLKNL